jgi:outer membrane receptor protein involved in Fe transport
MRRSIRWRRLLITPAALGILAYCEASWSAEGTNAPVKETDTNTKQLQIVPPPATGNTILPLAPLTQLKGLLLVQEQVTPFVRPGAAELTTTTGGVTGFVAPSAISDTMAAPRITAATGTGSEVQISGGQSQPRAASDVGDLLGKSQESTGVELQRRGPVVSDPRIRGYRVGQVVTIADGGFFFPARLDLDTAISKYDSSQLRDVIIFKGPYSVLYGPGFAFLDIASSDTPRYPDGFEYHGRTKTGWQSNGERIDGMQALWGGGPDWGFRLSYAIRTGNDYEAGNGYRVPSSYNSQPYVFTLGANLTCDSKLEYKGLHLEQRGVEFAGLYFDINRLTTEAEAMRYTIEHQELFDRMTIDVWWNNTSAFGDTHQGAKQAFLGVFLTNSFFPPGQPNPNMISLVDRSDTDFKESSRGFRSIMTWGEAGKPQLSVGTDLNFINNELNENIRILSQDNIPVPLFQGMTEGTQNLGVPSSHIVDPGVFAELVLPVNKRFKIKTGVRGDWVEENSGPRLVRGTVPIFFQPPGLPPITSFDPILFSSQPNNNELRAEFPLWASYISGDYKIDEHVTALAQFGYSMRAPTLTEMYATGPFIAVLQQGLDRLYGDPHLAPEKLKQMDVGMRFVYPWIRGGFSGFYAWVDDYITYDANVVGSSSVAGSPISQVVFTNTDHATLAGGEVFVDFDLNEWAAPFGSMTYVEGRDLTHQDMRRPLNLVSSRRDIPSEPLPGIPPLEGRVGIRIHEPSRARGTAPRWSVEIGVRMVREQNLVATSLGEQPTSGFSVWDARAFWQVNKALLLTAGVENFGDKFYREHLDPLAGFPTDLLFRPGTNVYLGAQLEF